ncbi:MAG: hypothetical protein IJ558_04840 [Treponema sp.]|nr:hypothetical protein [Treponema sp.]
MILTEEPRYWFYPEFNGNLKEPEEKQIAVEIIRPTGFQTKELKSFQTVREYYENDQPFDEKGEAREVGKIKRITFDVNLNTEYILEHCVGKIKNLSVMNNGTEREISDGKELANCRAYGIDALVLEISKEVSADKLTDAKKKNIG